MKAVCGEPWLLDCPARVVGGHSCVNTKRHRGVHRCQCGAVRQQGVGKNKKTKSAAIRPGQKMAVCHPDRPARARSMCANCYNSWRWHRDADRHREHRRELSARPEAQAAARARYLKKQFDLTPEEYDTLLEEQQGVCAICRRPPKKRRLNVDHNHKTGAIRGLLCYRCNKGLSFFSDDPQLFSAACDYLLDDQLDNEEAAD